MTVRVEPRNGRWVADIRVRGPDGPVPRERRNVPEEITSRTGAERWAENRARHLALHGAGKEEAPAPYFSEFCGRWMLEYVMVEGLKPSTIDTYKRHIDLHLNPALGKLRVDQIDQGAIQRLKIELAEQSAKSRADILGTLGTILRRAERWELIDRAPRIDKPRVAVKPMEFYDFVDLDRLVAGAKEAGPQVYAAILLAGDAGLRRGELIALEQADVARGAVTVQRNEWRGIVGPPKGGKHRIVPMTPRLSAAVEAIRHKKGKRLLQKPKGKPVKITTLQSWLETALRHAGMMESRNLHRLRHTFCSHLAMMGVPVGSIMELAGHVDLKTTMKYMHLAKGSLEAAIAMLARGAGREQMEHGEA